RMRLLLASSEIHPYSKTGGLADMVGALGKALAGAGHEVALVTPLYPGIRDRFPLLKPLGFAQDLPLGASRVHSDIFVLKPSPGLIVYFVDQPGVDQRPA